jgi:RNA polymerase sigma-70 factor, ECF subfamily
MITNSRQLAFDGLVRSLSPDLYRFAFWLCKSRALAQDLMQECFLRAWKSAEDLRDIKSAKAWMMTILRREFLRTFERKQFDLTDLEDIDIADTATPGLDEQNDSAQLRQLIGKLESKYRIPLMLQVLGGLSGAEIAAEIGSNEATVNTQLFRAREQLKTMIAAPAANRNNPVNIDQKNWRAP